MVAGDSVVIPSDVTTQRAAMSISAGSVSGLGDSVFAEVSEVLAPPVQAVSGSVAMVAGSAGRVSGFSDLLFSEGSDAGSEALGFVTSVSEGLGVLVLVLAAKDSVSGSEVSTRVLGSDSAFSLVGVGGKGSVSAVSGVSDSVLASSDLAAKVSVSVSDWSEEVLGSGCGFSTVGSGGEGLVSSVAGDSGAVLVSSDLASKVAVAVSGLSLKAPVSGSGFSSVGIGGEGSVSSVSVSTVAGFSVPGSDAMAVSAPVSATRTVQQGLPVSSAKVTDSSTAMAVQFSDTIGSRSALVAAPDAGLSSEQFPAVGKDVDVSRPVHLENQNSYLAAVQKKSALSKHDLSFISDEGGQFVQVPDDILQDVNHLWDDLIIGKFPEDSPHIAKVHVIVNKIWTYGNKLARIDAFVVNKTTIKFRIKDPVIRAKVLRRGM